jgi:RNA polymerase sigma factor (sigma-70 family)
MCQVPAMTVSRLLHLLRDDPLLAATEQASDAQLLRRFVSAREEAAFAALLRRHSGMVWGVCLRILSQHQDAEDAFQATFLILLRKAWSIRPAGMVGNWLYGVAHHTALKARAMSNKRTGRERHEAALLAGTPARPDGNAELQELLDQELSRLPDKYRAIIVLCELEGKTRAEAARHLGLPEGTVAGRLTRARAMLARRLARQGLALTATALASVMAQECAAAAPVSVVVSALQTAHRAAAAGIVSAKITALTEGVLKTMFLHKMLRATTLVMLVVFIVSGAAMVLPWALAQAPSGTTTGPVVDNPQARQDTFSAKRTNAKGPQKKVNMPDDEQPAWSKTVGGLQARLRLDRGDPVNGTPILQVLLDLRNVSEPKQGLQVTLSSPLSDKNAHFTVTDAAGKELPRYNGPYDGVHKNPEKHGIAAGDTLIYVISARGVGIPPNEAALLDLGASHNWIFKAGDKNTYYLQARLDWPGIGTIDVPKARIPTSEPAPQAASTGYVKAEIRGRLIHKDRDFHLVVQVPRWEEKGAKAYSLIIRTNADKSALSRTLANLQDQEVFASGNLAWLVKDHRVDTDDDWLLGMVFRDDKQLRPADNKDPGEFIKVEAKGVLVRSDSRYRLLLRLQENIAKEVTFDLWPGEDKMLLKKLEAFKDNQVIVSGNLALVPRGLGAADENLTLGLAQFQIKAAVSKPDTPPQKGESPLSGLPDQDRIQWDLKALDTKWKIISTAMKADEFTEVVLLLEAKAETTTDPSDFRAHLFDKDKVRIEILSDGGGNPAVTIEGGIPPEVRVGSAVHVAAGERLRVFLRLPAKATWQNVRNVLIGTSDVPR